MLKLLIFCLIWDQTFANFDLWTYTCLALKGLNNTDWMRWRHGFVTFLSPASSPITLISAVWSSTLPHPSNNRCCADFVCCTSVSDDDPIWKQSLFVRRWGTMQLAYSLAGYWPYQHNLPAVRSVCSNLWNKHIYKIYTNWPVVTGQSLHGIDAALAWRSSPTHTVTMNSTVPINSTGEELFTTASQTIPDSSSSSEDMWTTETMATVAGIVTDSRWEQGITAGLLIFFWLYVNFTNGSLFYVIRKEYSLHTPQYMVLGSYMVFDVLYCNLTLLHMVPVVISNKIKVMPDMVSRIIVAVYMSFLLSSFHLIGLQAYERYSYFITPLKYPRKFTKRRIFTAVIIVLVLAFCFAFGADLISPRIPVATIMTYQVTGLATKLTSISYAVFYAIPSGTMSVVTLIKLRALISKHKAQLQSAVSIDMNEDQSAISGILVKPVKKALKMVGLVSGSFWLTITPGFLTRIGLSASGVTWAYTDQRISLSLFALSRASYMLLTVMSSILNPIIYITVLTELREAIWKCIGIKRNNSDTDA